jgi:hypothetical protein
MRASRVHSLTCSIGIRDSLEVGQFNVRRRIQVNITVQCASHTFQFSLMSVLLAFCWKAFPARVGSEGAVRRSNCLLRGPSFFVKFIPCSTRCRPPCHPRRSPLTVSIDSKTGPAVHVSSLLPGSTWTFSDVRTPHTQSFVLPGPYI